jgi:hypothetical protein
LPADNVQVLLINTSTFFMQFASSGSSNMASGTAEIIAPGTSATYIWDGVSLWWPQSVVKNYGGIFGDGSDNSATLDGIATFTWASLVGSTYTMTRDCYLTSFVVNNGITLTTSGFKIFCQGTGSNAGTIACNGNNGAAGGVAGAQTSTNTSLAPGGPGGGGQTTNGTNGFTGGGGNIGVGGGGTAGTGSSGTAGIGSGAATGSTNVLRPPQILATGTVGWNGGTRQLGGAGGGGGGGGDSVNKGGGGGSGGGCIGIAAWSLVNTGTISAIGGNGGTPTTGNCGGGGGGGGGLILVYTLAAWTAGTTNVGGGTQGNGIGTGTDGNNGTIGHVLNVVIR